jgi:coenzyme F420-reducing hydrogenase beta subunit/acetyltransferase-like isoleucine patch superfamily enzyme
MINVVDKKDCCGCNACYDACPQKAISLKTDVEGFWYPVVNQDICVNCGLCDKVCPQQHSDELKKNEFEKPVCFAATHKNIETRFGSTTGGLFSALAEQMYAEGGFVGGAVYLDDWSVRHFISNNPEDLFRLRQSKYSQSDTRGFFAEVKKLLNAGEKVLVCGTPCQMAGLRQFLRKDYENLIVIDFICKSITSPKFYAKYLDYWERKAKSKLTSFKFKDKELGWRNLVKRFDFANGKTMYSRANDNDLYSSAYHGNIVSRPSCYDCRFKGFPRMADITIADFWGCEKYDKYKCLDDNAGTSAVIINNSRGLNFFEKIKSRIICVESSIENILPGNPALLHKQKSPDCDRDAFFEDLDKDLIENVVPKYVAYLGHSEKISAKTRVKKILTPFYHAVKKHINPFRFLYYNFFCKNVKTEWMSNGVIYPHAHSVIELQKGSVLELHGPLDLGTKKVKRSKLETRLLLETNARMVINESARIMYGSDVEVFKNAELHIDELGTNINFTLICGKKIELKGHVSAGRDVSIRDTNAHTIAIDGYKVLRPVLIENHVWLCSNVHVSPGVKIRAGSVVAANSIVVQNVAAHTLVGGNPLKVIQNNIAWKL